MPRVARAARSRRTGGSSSPASMAAGGDKRGEERRLPGGERERKELAATVGRPIRPGCQLGHLALGKRSRGLSLGLNHHQCSIMSFHRFIKDLQSAQKNQRSTKYSKFS